MIRNERIKLVVGILDFAAKFLAAAAVLRPWIDDSGASGWIEGLMAFGMAIALWGIAAYIQGYLKED